MKHNVAIVGTGPAALMAAYIVADAGHPVTIFEKLKGPAKKLLIAGSTGLNITYDAPLASFHEHYKTGQSFLKEILKHFSPKDWIEFVHSLNIKTFLGTSKRYFVEGMKASQLLRNWLKTLKSKDCNILYGSTVTDFEIAQKISLSVNGKKIRKKFAAVCFCLGGGSYLPQPADWPALFKRHNISINDFQASNVGYEVNWSTEFLKEAEGLPLKNVTFTSSRGSMQGDLIVTRFGLEGTPVYSLGEVGEVFLDLKPEWSHDIIVKKMSVATENLSPIRRAKKYLNLSAAVLALLFHHGEKKSMATIESLAMLIKKFPLNLLKPRPLDEAISSSGGIALDELDGNLMLKKLPGIFAGGEMLDWDAPTGGFLIQGCVSQGYVAGKGIINYLSN